jgi:hypothetical protein
MIDFIDDPGHKQQCFLLLLRNMCPRTTIAVTPDPVDARSTLPRAPSSIMKSFAARITGVGSGIVYKAKIARKPARPATLAKRAELASAAPVD